MYTLGTGVAKRRHHATLLDEDGTPVFRHFALPHSAPRPSRLVLPVLGCA